MPSSGFGDDPFDYFIAAVGVAFLLALASTLFLD